MMDKNEFMHYWYYCCSLCTQLQKTREYVEHKPIYKDGTLLFANANTYSNEFLKILLATAAEFETIGKLLCKENNQNFNDKSDIVKISEAILQKYPKIGETKIGTDFGVFQPLSGWKIATNDEGKKYVDGLAWWRAYTDIKHQRYNFYSSATLENAINALASLLALELYLGKVIMGSVSDLSGSCDYFFIPYGHMPLKVRCTEMLPDFID